MAPHTNIMAADTGGAPAMEYAIMTAPSPTKQQNNTLPILDFRNKAPHTEPHIPPSPNKLSCRPSKLAGLWRNERINVGASGIHRPAQRRLKKHNPIK